MNAPVKYIFHPICSLLFLRKAKATTCLQWNYSLSYQLFSLPGFLIVFLIGTRVQACPRLRKLKPVSVTKILTCVGVLNRVQAPVEIQIRAGRRTPLLAHAIICFLPLSIERMLAKMLN